MALPDGLTQLSNNVFCECSSLTSVALPDGVTQLGDNAFYLCSSLTSVSLPDGPTQLGDGVFCYCSSLTSVSLPDGLTQLGRYVFRGCSSLTSVALPDGLTQLGVGVFDECSSLTIAANFAGFDTVERLSAVPQTHPLDQRFARLATTEPGRTTQQECPICFEKICENDGAALPCMHSFHTRCIRPWLIENNTCPVCRHAV